MTIQKKRKKFLEEMKQTFINYALETDNKELFEQLTGKDGHLYIRMRVNATRNFLRPIELEAREREANANRN